MKTGTLKTLGTAALGVAFAATAAGTASAATTLPDLGSLANQLPVGQVAKLLPGASQAAGAVTGTLHSVPESLSAAGDKGLLGGLPVKGLPVDGLPLGG